MELSSRNVFVVFSLISGVCSVQKFLSVPTYSEVNPGDEVVLLCEVENKGGECRWEKDGTPVGIFPEKYEWAGDVASGNCSLLILDTSAEYDDGVWQCQVTASNFRKGDSLISEGAELVVRSPPTKIMLVSKQGEVRQDSGVVVGTAGSMMDVKCVTTGGNPVPRLAFTVNGNPVAAESEQINQRLTSGGWMSSLQLSYIPSKDEDGAEITCQAQHEALTTPLTTESNLRIFYTPSVTNVLLNSTNPDQGDTVVAECQVQANPSPSITWSRQSQPGEVIGHGDRLVLTNMEPSMNDVYVCQAENEVGIGEARSAMIVTNHAPVITDIGPTDNILLVTGQSVTLSCHAEASPLPQYTWIHQTLAGDTAILGHADTLTMEDVTFSAAGQYYCQASNIVAGQVKEVLSSGITVEVRGAPVMREVEQMINVVEGETLEIAVEFCSNPTPVMSWRHGQQIVGSEDARVDYSVASAGDNCAVATLNIYMVSEQDSGEYFLTIENEHGQSQQMFIISVTKTIFTREIIIAIVAAAILTPLLLIFLIVSMVKRCKRSKEQVKDVESCGTSTTSDNNKNEKLESEGEEEIVFNESYEKFETDPSVPTSILHQKPRSYKPSYTDLCNYPLSANGGSMRVNSSIDNVEKIISSYNANIMNHINTINYSAYNNQDNIYYWRQNFDNTIYS